MTQLLLKGPRQRVLINEPIILVCPWWVCLPPSRRQGVGSFRQGGDRNPLHSQVSIAASGPKQAIATISEETMLLAIARRGNE